MTIGSATVTTTYEYTLELGHRYALRVRATDHVSNTDEWVEASTPLFGDQRDPFPYDTSR
jgi:hypothetical protein